MKTHFGVAATMLEALSETVICAQMITTSEIKISVLVERSLAIQALRAVHGAFGLDVKTAGEAVPFIPGRRPRLSRSRSQGDDGWCPTIDQETRMSGLENLVITAVELDDRQGRVTILNMPDRPGFAAQILRQVAEQSIFVDMIVQNISLVGMPTLSITVPRKDVDRAVGGGRHDRRATRGCDRARHRQALGLWRRHEITMRSGRNHVPCPGRARDRRFHGQYQRDLGECGHRPATGTCRPGNLATGFSSIRPAARHSAEPGFTGPQPAPGHTTRVVTGPFAFFQGGYHGLKRTDVRGMYSRAHYSVA